METDNGIVCSSLSEFIKEFPPMKLEWDNEIFYRGESDFHYTLKPSVLRDTIKIPKSERENEIYFRVLSECSNEFISDMTHIAILSRMQHYGVPTRLLDITTNALVALYFCCENKAKWDVDGVVYFFQPSAKQVKTFDSDTVSILASLARFSKQEKEELKCKALECIEVIKNRPNSATEIIREFNNLECVKRLIHEVRAEKNYFDNIVNPNDLLGNYFIIPKKDNPRIIRQNGAFIIFGLNGIMELKDVAMGKVRISKEGKQKILRELKYLGISKATLHPELYKMAEYINDNINSNSRF